MTMATGHDAFKVYRVCSTGGESAERQMVASFVRYIEAKVFIHSELLSYPLRGMRAECFWGSDDHGGHVHFWIQSPQITASVRNAAG